MRSSLANSNMARTLPKPTAATRVFGIVEVLEEILLTVPRYNLFVVQRVNTTFRDTITTSHKLQEMLCKPLCTTPSKNGEMFFLPRCIQRATLASYLIGFHWFKTYRGYDSCIDYVLRPDYRSSYLQKRFLAGQDVDADESWRHIQFSSVKGKVKMIVWAHAWSELGDFVVEEGARLGEVVDKARAVLVRAAEKGFTMARA
ncbi:hypothetical protein AC579_9785 [Pseudocercospora musae]|uniref:F-box domain-containing protein n=1 Tax=Pseudocercospora musae TaxID=113226 RepID=A0A139IVP9_9PEZI|nr:hypothetical protein AC579_9785 [Pseudocercospora musae]